MFTVVENEKFESTTISSAHFGTNFVTSFDNEFTEGSSNNELLETMNVSNLRFPGGAVTEHIFDMTNPDSTIAADGSSAVLMPMCEFFATAGEVEADVTLVIPTKVAFVHSMEQALAEGLEGESGGYGSRNQLKQGYIDEVLEYVEEALADAAANGVEVTVFEIGNEFWGSGNMTATEYGFVAGKLAVALDAEFPSVEIIVQGVAAANEHSPRYPTTVYLEPLGGDYRLYSQQEYDKAIKNGENVEEWLVRELPGNGAGLFQTAEIARQISSFDGAADAIGGIVQHAYFQGGFSGVDEERSTVLENVHDRFVSAMQNYLNDGVDRNYLTSNITEWGARGHENLGSAGDVVGLKYASMLNEVFFELVSHGVDAANAWPLTRPNDDRIDRVLVDTDDGDLTFGGTIFQLMSEALVGLDAVVDFEVSTEVDVHGYANEERFVAFVSERSGGGQDAQFDFDSFLPKSDVGVYFYTWTHLTTDGDPLDDESNPTLDYRDGGHILGGGLTVSLDPWAIVRLEVTAITAGADYLQGRAGNDVIAAGFGNDTLLGGNGNDSLYGGGDNDVIRAGRGHDLLNGGLGNDILTGGAGSDTFQIGLGQGRDVITDFTIGEDNLSFVGTGSLGQASVLPENISIGYAPNGDLVISFGDVSDTGDGLHSVVFQGIKDGGFLVQKTLNGTAKNDLLNGGAAADTLSGSFGDDTLFGAHGDDLLIGGEGADNIHGESGADNMRGGNGEDTLNGGKGDDTIQGGNGSDVVNGGAGMNKLFGQRGEDTLVGGEGNDTLNSGGGADFCKGGQGNDWFRAGNGEDTLWGGNGRDTMFGNSEDDVLLGGADNDRIFGGGGDDTIQGGSGDDFIKGGDGSDTFIFKEFMGADSLHSFSKSEDFLLIDAGLVDGLTTGSEVLATFGTVVGKDMVLDFGNGCSITLLWADNIGNISDAILVV